MSKRTQTGSADDASSVEERARRRTQRSENLWLRLWYVRWILPRVGDPLVRQRLKLLYFGWGYWRILLLGLPLGRRLRFLRRFLRIDWNVLHAHLPSEMARMAAVIAERPSRPGEIVVEAGCWQGGSSTKLSILCKELGYQLHIYDSFEGVETLDPEDQAREWEFAGQYASPQDRLQENLDRFGEPDVCSIHKGWFSETLAKQPVSSPVRIVYIDCDLGKGTVEALRGTVPSLVDDGCIFSQDFHIEPVRRVLLDPATWLDLGVTPPSIRQDGVYLASMRLSGRPAADTQMSS